MKTHSQCLNASKSYTDWMSIYYKTFVYIWDKYYHLATNSTADSS